MPDAPPEHTLITPAECAGLRLDQALARLFPEYSRVAWQRCLSGGQVLVDGRPGLAKQRLAGGEQLQLTLPQAQPLIDRPQPITLDVLREAPEFYVLNKPAGLVMHPGAGNPTGTLLNGLLKLDPALADLPRAGIVHRLDKDTSGLLLVARSERARLSFIEQLSSRRVRRGYLALVHGRPIAGETISQPIGRHPVARVKMAVRADGKPASTKFRVLEKFTAHSLIAATLGSGRTHQIRVHMQWRGFPLLGDPLYGRRISPPAEPPALNAAIRAFKRQALHAETLSFADPADAAEHTVQHPPPEDFQQLLAALRAAG